MGNRRKTATKRLPAVAAGDQPYRPSCRSTASEQSPYLTRPAEVQYAEGVLSDEEEGEKRRVVEEKGRWRGGSGREEGCGGEQEEDG